MSEFKFSRFQPLTTERLLIRPLSDSDLLQLHKIRSDATVNRYINRKNAADISETKEFIQKISELVQHDTCLYWAIAFKDQKALIGTICYWNFNYNKEEAEIGYELLPEFQGKSIMFEAVQCVIQFGFEMLKLKTISAFISENNTKSISLLNKFHFKKIHDNSTNANTIGNWMEKIRFSLVKAEFQNS